MNNDKVFKIYGDNLKRFRTNNNLTQEQAAQITKLEAKYIRQIERGVRTGTIVTMLKFCTGYNVTPNDLFYNIRTNNCLSIFHYQIIIFIKRTNLLIQVKLALSPFNLFFYLFYFLHSS